MANTMQQRTRADGKKYTEAVANADLPGLERRTTFHGPHAERAAHRWFLRVTGTSIADVLPADDEPTYSNASKKG